MFPYQGIYYLQWLFAFLLEHFHVVQCFYILLQYSSPCREHNVIPYKVCSFCLSAVVSWRNAEEREDRRRRELVRQHEGRGLPTTDSSTDDSQQEAVQRTEEARGTGLGSLTCQ